MELIILQKPIHASPFKLQPHKMVEHTQTIRQQSDDELFERI